MKGVLWEEAFSELAMVVAINEELNVFRQGLHSSRETSRSASQTFEIMAKICIDRFHRIGFLFVGAHFVGSPIVECVIDRESIGIILFGLRCTFQAGLQSF